MVFNFSVSASSMGRFEIEIENVTINDDIHEIEQSFALVAEIGDDVLDRFACFQRQVGDTECFGRSGATIIRITDNDRK